MGRGDSGRTGALGARISKASKRIAAVGAIDEAAAAVGLARSLSKAASHRKMLIGCQQALHKCAAEVAAAGGGRATDFDFGAAVKALTREIGRVEKAAGAPDDFVFFGDNPAAAGLNVARATVRRAERAVCSLGRNRPVRLKEVAAYLNRLSDLLFALAWQARGRRSRR
jgi:cob(I)alamin adenosyltransferase